MVTKIAEKLSDYIYDEVTNSETGVLPMGLLSLYNSISCLSETIYDLYDRESLANAVLLGVSPRNIGYMAENVSKNGKTQYFILSKINAQLLTGEEVYATMLKYGGIKKMAKVVLSNPFDYRELYEKLVLPEIK